jgi:hypothetical protein
MTHGDQVGGRDASNELQDLVLRRLAELGVPGSPMSIREATRRTRSRVNYETLRKIARGEHSGDIADQTAEGLSLALDIPLQEVYAAARVPRPLGRWEMPARFDRLNLEDRRVVEEMAAALLRAREQGLRDRR